MTKQGKIGSITALSIAMLVGVSCKVNNKEDSQAAIDQLESQETINNVDHSKDLVFNDIHTGETFQHYIHIKTALVNSDVIEIKSAARMLSTTMADGDMEIAEITDQMASTEDIHRQRALFSKLTDKMEDMLDGSLTSGEIYKQFCPMAFNNTGGYWLSKEKEISNPYFGERMLKCGIVEKVMR